MSGLDRTNQKDVRTADEESLYNTWASMRKRCTNPNAWNYKYYGAKGIKVCARWNSFKAFKLDMGLRPSPAHSIDRRNNKGDYEPDNCRWATKEEQEANK